MGLGCGGAAMGAMVAQNNRELLKGAQSASVPRLRAINATMPMTIGGEIGPETGVSGGDVAGQEFWESTWSTAKPAFYRGPIFQFAPLAEKYLPKIKGLTLIELGAMPGNHLVYFNKEFGYRVCALDYVADMDVVKKTFAINGVTDCEIVNCNLFDYFPDEKYDVVFSTGLIEHFEDWQAIWNKHIDFLKPDGFLFIGLPNTRFLHWIFMKLFCPSILAVHRMYLMSPKTLKRLSVESGLDVLFCNYIATYRPFYPVPTPIQFVSRVVIKLLNVTGLGNVPNRFGSPFIFLVARGRSGRENLG
jgi:2-polyprenyl-3-methyl-5-hydroxy-6-metoxy-1,4-benzoquinol methylase